MTDSEADELPRPGTIAWVQAHDLIERDGVMLPSCHRIPADATVMPADGDKRCRVVYVSGDRCKGTRLHAYGLCMGHVGGGGMSDPAAMARQGADKLKELRVTRQLLGIGPRTAANPRAVVRLRAAQRANELALAIVDGPLDADLGAVEKQRAALSVLDAAFPLQAMTVSVDVDDPDSMSWNDMQAIATSLLG